MHTASSVSHSSLNPTPFGVCTSPSPQYPLPTVGVPLAEADALAEAEGLPEGEGEPDGLGEGDGFTQTEFEVHSFAPGPAIEMHVSLEQAVCDSGTQSGSEEQ